MALPIRTLVFTEWALVLARDDSLVPGTFIGDVTEQVDSGALRGKEAAAQFDRAGELR